MKKEYTYEIGDVVTMKKPHPCGSKEWEILRVGADFRLKCMGCGHQIMIARKLVEKNTKDQKEVQDDMNKYELAVVVSAKIEDDERAQVIEKVKALVERFGGQISDVDEWGKKRLAYEIQKMKEAYYYFIHFESDAETPSEIEQRIRIMDNVIRFLCVRQDA